MRFAEIIILGRSCGWVTWEDMECYESGEISASELLMRRVPKPARTMRRLYDGSYEITEFASDKAHLN
jgi:hypothetical protein